MSITPVAFSGTFTNISSPPVMACQRKPVELPSWILFSISEKAREQYGDNVEIDCNPMAYPGEIILKGLPPYESLADEFVSIELDKHGLQYDYNSAHPAHKEGDTLDLRNKKGN